MKIFLVKSKKAKGIQSGRQTDLQSGSMGFIFQPKNYTDDTRINYLVLILTIMATCMMSIDM